MEITIVGAGAIGGTLGAYMVRAGERVRFVDADPEHVAAMRQRGLTIRGFAETFTVPVDACTPNALTGPLDTVLLAVKAQHTETAVRRLLPLLRPTSAIVSCQNGLCERQIADLAGVARTVGCFVNFSADYLEPGLIHYGGPGAAYLGELDGSRTPRIEALQRLFSHWGETRITANIWGYLWGKMGYGTMLFATALADVTMAEAIDRYRPLMVELATEIYEVAAREGVTPEPFDSVVPSLFYPRDRRDHAALALALDDLVARRRRDQKAKSGIWRDLAVRRRPTEVDGQIALAARIGAGHGLPMPLTHALVEAIHDLEQGRRQMSWANLDALDSLRRSLDDRPASARAR